MFAFSARNTSAEWYFDSVATNHMRGYKNEFNNLQNYTDFKILTTNWSTIKSDSKVNVRMPVTISNKTDYIQLSIVLYLAPLIVWFLILMSVR